jgi:hypothetical protein
MHQAMNAARISPFILAALLLGSSAHADPSADDKRNANTLVLEGNRLLKAGDAYAALAKFQAAHEILRTPTTGINVATAYEALGQLVEARAMVFEVSHLPTQPNEPFSFLQARASAKAAIEALDSRIPSLALRIQGAPKETVTATVDGNKVPSNLLAEPFSRNPGKHEIVVTAPGYRTARTTVELVEGMTKPVEVPLVLERDEDASTPTRNNVFVYAGITVSGTLAAVALGTGIGAALTEEKANADWEAANCTRTDKDRCYMKFDEQEAKRVVLGSTAVWTAVGAVAVGGGTLAYILLTKAPENKPAKQTVRVSPTLGGIVVWGAF